MELKLFYVQKTLYTLHVSKKCKISFNKYSQLNFCPQNINGGNEDKVYLNKKVCTTIKIAISCLFCSYN